MVKSGLASPLFLCKYPQENITIQRVVAKQADTLQQTARIRLAAGKGRSMRRKEEIEREEKEKRKQFLKEHKKISFFIKKDIYEKLEIITDNPEEYICKTIEKLIERGV